MAPNFDNGTQHAPPYIALKQPGKYRVIAIPVPVPEDYPASGLIGDICWTSSCNGACLDIMGKKFIVPFDCIEEVSDKKPIEDAELITIMLNNPYGVYKLLRGLWRITKNPTIRNFMERGELPPGSNKTPAEYDKQWKEAEAAILEDEAALSGAFSTEICS